MSVKGVRQNIWHVVLLWLVTSCIDSGNSDEEVLHRDKRFLLYPYGGTFKLVLGIAIPVKLGSRQSMAIGWNFQYQYAEAQNASQIETYPPIVSRSRDKRDQTGAESDRALAYLGIESMLESHGIDGRACLLRSICENALHPLDHKANGLYGQLLHIALTPDYGVEDIEPDLDPTYIEAQRAGEFGVDCLSLYPTCKYGHGLLDSVSLLDF